LDIESIIGSSGIRISTAAATLVLTTAVVVREYAVAPRMGSVPYSVFCFIVGAAALIGLVYSFRGLYTRWLAFAEFLQGVVVTVLFGTCYLVVVPWFYLLARVIDMLRSRGHHQTKSFWVLRRQIEFDENYFSRMG
jgi:hypothetical protein